MTPRVDLKSPVCNLGQLAPLNPNMKDLGRPNLLLGAGWDDTMDRPKESSAQPRAAGAPKPIMEDLCRPNLLLGARWNVTLYP